MMRRLFCFAVAVTLPLAAPFHGVAAQTFPTDDPILRRIWAIGMDSSRTMELSSALLDSIGPRLAGSPGQKRAQDWLIRTYASMGIPAKNEQYGTWRGWRRGWTHVDLVSPRVRTLEATMVGYSPGTGGKDVTAGTIVLPRFPDSAAFVRWLPQARGKLVLVSAPLPSCRPTADWTEFATAASRARMDSLRAEVTREWSSPNVRGTGYSLALAGGGLGLRLDEAGVAGVITSRPTNAVGTRSVFETYNTRSPTLSLSCEDYGLLFRLTERGSNPQVRMNLDAELLGEQPMANTIATVRGTQKPNEYVMLSAHFDSWDGASGATDNGTGTITMLEAMRILRQVYPNPKRTIVAGHWTGEENGLVGSKAFREDHPEIVAGLQALFNQDNGTGRIVRMDASGLVDGDVHLRSYIAKLPTEFQQQIQYGGPGVPSGGGSDNASFACAGLPGFSLGSLNWNYGNETWHTERDTYDKIAFDDLKANAVLTAMLVYLASEDPTLIGRERVDIVKAVEEQRARFAQQNPTAARPTGPQTPPAWPACGTAPRKTNPRL
ncbi:MAG: M20/M25/M40 family metallo-hydrolase [Gemmatimonadaceae bacterium]|nr:M20/M25/M40 family metallo-hydrolase [Gemmatimonadaceae bacterium]NUO95085.1 M20/M25/M40 family metallo-hydrolase [Gemmatimonadaceae bacterium]NUP55523.1 M20/M25/M40 family metallo-hydrolase [Gemmatimonadaceae bacterium]NUR36322.1 M20/M25/M40 family metallo-hydrolase [Gemmatimonadaceae bacterium]NUS47376.1 M20/M25/M40 family metallo-hydrolase [Gemmatimonadaceae bacterium]